MDIGPRIRALRERRRMTQLELAEKVGVNPTAVTLWESKTTPRGITHKNLGKVAEALSVSVSELLGEREIPESTGRSPMSSIIVTAAEKTLLELFRSFPQELQLLQLAQFVECAKLRRVEHFTSDVSGNGLPVSASGSSQTA